MPRYASSRMDDKKKGWLQALLVLVFAGVAFAASEWIASLAEVPAASDDQAVERVLAVEVERVAPVARSIRFTLTGTVQAEKYVELAPEVSGRVVSVARTLSSGKRFRAGTVLFRIESKDYEFARRNQRARVAEARRALRLRKAEAATARKEWDLLHPGEEPPPLVAKVPQLEEAEAALEAARSSLANAELDVERTRFKLPFDGRVVESQIEKGQLVTAGQSYGRVYRGEALEVVAAVTAEQAEWLQQTDELEVTIRVVQNDDKVSFAGTFSRMGAEAEVSTRFSNAIFDFAEPVKSVVPGEFAEIEVVGPKVDGVWELPISALQSSQTLWVVGDDDRLEKLEPEVLLLTEDHVLARSNGEAITVVAQALREATRGTKVEVRNVD